MSRYVLRVSMLCCVLLATSLGSLAPVATAEQTDEELAAEKKVLNLVNRYRVNNGLAPLQLDEFIRKEARKHSFWMAAHGELSHDNFEERRQAIAEHDSGIKETKICENTGRAPSYLSPGPMASGVVRAWKNTRSLRRCMLDAGFTKNVAGVGVHLSGDTWWVTFIAARDTTP